MALALLCLVAIFFTTNTNGAEVIYSDDFSTVIGSDLNATAPDVRPASEVWKATVLATDTYSEKYLDASGFIGGITGVEAWNATVGANLPFVPAQGRVYELSADLTAYESSNLTKLTLGFSEKNSTIIWKSAYNNTNVNGYAHLSLYLIGSQTNGPGNTAEGVLDGGEATYDAAINRGQAYSVKIVFDTRPAASADWTMEWFVDDVQVRAPTKVSSGSYADIAFVGFTTAKNRTRGLIDNFLLEDASVQTGTLYRLY